MVSSSGRTVEWLRRGGPEAWAGVPKLSVQGSGASGRQMGRSSRRLPGRARVSTGSIAPGRIHPAARGRKGGTREACGLSSATPVHGLAGAGPYVGTRPVGPRCSARPRREAARGAAWPASEARVGADRSRRAVCSTRRSTPGGAAGARPRAAGTAGVQQQSSFNEAGVHTVQQARNEGAAGDAGRRCGRWRLQSKFVSSLVRGMPCFLLLSGDVGRRCGCRGRKAAGHGRGLARRRCCWP